MASERFQTEGLVDVHSMDYLWRAFEAIEESFLPALLKRGSGSFRVSFESTTERSTAQADTVAAVRDAWQRAGFPLTRLRLEVHEEQAPSRQTHNAYVYWRETWTSREGAVPVHVSVWGPDEADVLGLGNLAERVLQVIAAEAKEAKGSRTGQRAEVTSGKRDTPSEADGPTARRGWLRSPTLREGIVIALVGALVTVGLERVL
jgi:hypothetical protein